MARCARLFSSIAVTTAVLLAAPLHATTLEFSGISSASSSASASASASSGPSGATASASASSSGPVPARITFDDANGAYMPFQPTPVGVDREVWQESGFHVSIDSQLAGYVQDYGLGVSDHYLSDSGCCDDAYSSMHITRTDGATFSFEDIEISPAHSSTIVEATFTPQGGSPFSSRTEGAFLNFDNIRLHGTRADGSTVEIIASAFTDIVDNPDVQTAPGVYVPASHLLLLGDPERDRLSDLTSLHISSGVFDDPFDMYRASAPYVGVGNGLNRYGPLHGLSEEMMLGYNECLVVRRQESCTIDGVGEFDFFWDSNYIQNYSSAIYIGNMAFSVNDAPAPVPLPAGGLLLIAAGGMLVGLRRRARARANA